MKVTKKKARRVVTVARTARTKRKRRAVIREGQEARGQSHHGPSRRTPKRLQQALQPAELLVDVDCKHQLFPCSQFYILIPAGFGEAFGLLSEL
jgi:hypothetical protein